MESLPAPSPGWQVPFPEAEVRALVAELGMPRETHWARIASDGAIPRFDKNVRVFFEGGSTKRVGEPMYWCYQGTYPTDRFAHKKWRGHGYSYEIFGLLLKGDPRRPDPCRGAFCWLPPQIGGGDLLVQFWRRRAHFGDSPVYAEVLWHPERGERHLIGGLERPHTDQDIQTARRGLKFLLVLPANLGRPPGKEAYPTKDSWVTALRELNKKAKRQGWDLTNAAWYPDDWIAKQLCVGTTVLYDRNREHDIRLDDIRDGKI